MVHVSIAIVCFSLLSLGLLVFLGYVFVAAREEHIKALEQIRTHSEMALAMLKAQNIAEYGQVKMDQERMQLQLEMVKDEYEKEITKRDEQITDLRTGKQYNISDLDIISPEQARRFEGLERFF